MSEDRASEGAILEVGSDTQTTGDDQHSFFEIMLGVEADREAAFGQHGIYLTHDVVEAGEVIGEVAAWLLLRLAALEDGRAERLELGEGGAERLGRAAVLPAFNEGVEAFELFGREAGLQGLLHHRKRGDRALHIWLLLSVRRVRMRHVRRVGFVIVLAFVGHS